MTMPAYLTATLLCILACVITVGIFFYMADMSSTLKYIKYKREFNKKCLKTTPCQCCAYWNVRKEFCALDKQIQEKYGIDKKL